MNNLRRHSGRGRYFLMWGALLLLILWYFLHGQKNQAVITPISVVTAKSYRSDVPVFVIGLGTVTPVGTVTVKTQINGRLLRVYFREGQMVKQGDLLAQIDPKPYQAQLLQYQGQLQRDQATLENAKVDLQRYKKLYPQGAVSQQIYETQISTVNQLEGTVKFDQGQIQTVTVNLGYCSITSPINGRVGLRLVDPGNFVQTTDPSGIAVITSVNPITVIFPIPEDDVPSVMKQLLSGKTLVTQAYNRNMTELLDTGKLLTIDNQIDTTTGTVRLRAIFTNEHLTLFPNQFVNIKLLVNTLPNAILVPTAAIQQGANGTFVYTVNKNHAYLKAVQVGITDGNHTTINAGLSAGESVVTEGADKLTNGAPVFVANRQNSHRQNQQASK